MVKVIDKIYAEDLDKTALVTERLPNHAVKVGAKVCGNNSKRQFEITELGFPNPAENESQSWFTVKGRFDSDELKISDGT